MTQRIFSLLPLFVAFMCADAESLPPRVAILPESQGPTLMRQCSRSAPSDVSGFWIPSVGEVMALERRLPEFLRKTQPEIKLPDYYRQYIGVISHGRKIIYLNAFTGGGLQVNPDRDWKTTGIRVCDGGYGFWGVEFDPADNSFHHFETNGVA